MENNIPIIKYKDSGINSFANNYFLNLENTSVMDILKHHIQLFNDILPKAEALPAYESVCDDRYVHICVDGITVWFTYIYESSTVTVIINFRECNITNATR